MKIVVEYFGIDIGIRIHINAIAIYYMYPK